MTTSRMRRLFLISMVTLGCRAADSVPEPGAALVRVTVMAGAPGPDELRAWVYDDTGRLWDSVRIPSEGALTVKSATELGTVLIQPGLTQGDLRLHVRAFAAGTRILDGVLSMTAPDRDKRTFALVLDPSVPVDADGDDVPDAIDDCLPAANALQGGCPIAPTNDAGTDALVDAPNDAGSDAPSDAEADTSTDGIADASADGIADASADGTNRDSSADAIADASADGIADASADGIADASADGTNRDSNADATPPPPKANGKACSAATECSSGFCSDKVCCDTACADKCQNCAGGTCQAVRRMADVPECSGANTCNPKGMCVAN